MKIMSVTPAAAASSTAYWISGLSTTGSISFGLALVAGKKRLPSPATGKTAFVTLASAINQSLQSGFVEDRHAKLARAIEFAARVRPRDEVPGLLRYAAGHLATLSLDCFLCRIARHRRQRSGQYEGNPGESSRGLALRFGVGPMYPGGAQLGNHLAVVRLAKELEDALREHTAHIVHFEQRRLVGVDQRVECTEMAGEVPSRGLADVADAQRENEPRQRCAAAALDRCDDVGGGLVGHALELGERSDPEAVEIG